MAALYEAQISIRTQTTSRLSLQCLSMQACLLGYGCKQQTSAAKTRTLCVVLTGARMGLARITEPVDFDVSQSQPVVLKLIKFVIYARVYSSTRISLQDFRTSSMRCQTQGFSHVHALMLKSLS